MTDSSTRVVTAQSAKRSATIFHYGNIVATLIPFPFFIFWFGGSMITYAMLRHNPNPRVGYYTQLGAYAYYGLAGLLIPVLTFAPGDFFQRYGVYLWIACASVMIPFSIYQIMKINREQWYDTSVSH